ncbi:MAG: UDP-N-acetylmuramoyl-L-alanyl-D-glutamate--2,6-diaminopimelate ligase [Bacteroidales bacterium]|nr:UDP-N-acetylmuramoyl-L-alanyl-D-glutamate--2,6-diaminopimelate ligase [Bacteroidales bacterium]
MKKLNLIIDGVETLEMTGADPSCLVRDISFDSRKIQPGTLFIAIKGLHTDGHIYIQSTIEAGACAIICEVLPEIIIDSVCYIKVPDSSKALGIIASNWFGNPSAKLKLLGITGTNGKTTTVTLLHQLFRQLGYHSGILSTIKNKIDEEEIPASHTTPDAIQLNELLARMVEKECKYCFMEVSSHAVIQNRITGLQFAGGIFSNLTHDHLDFHKTFEAYLKAKKLFFDTLSPEAFALTNIDDRNGRVMIQNTAAKRKTYSLLSLADFKGKIIESPLHGLHMEFDGIAAWCRLVGLFNGYNLLAAYSAAVLLGEDPTEVLTILSNLGSVEGRFDYLRSQEGTVGIIDYAHTPDALKNVLDTIHQLRKGKETLITVVGCGGDRDRSKRPVMANIACSGSEKLILTSDNPRSEDPAEILKEMLVGLDANQLRKTLVITDRHEAIKTAVMMSQPGDIILVAGKGHEKYQEIAGVKYPFDDKKILAELFNL